MQAEKATVEEFKKIDLDVLLKEAWKSKKAADVVEKTNQPLGACSPKETAFRDRCHVCRSDLDPALSMRWSELDGRMICLCCWAEEEPDREAMSVIALESIADLEARVWQIIEKGMDAGRSQGPESKSNDWDQWDAPNAISWRTPTLPVPEIHAQVFGPAKPFQKTLPMFGETGLPHASQVSEPTCPSQKTIRFADTQADEDKPAKKRKTDQDIPEPKGPPTTLGPTQVVAKPPVAQSIASMGPAKGTQEQAKGQDIAEVKKNPSVADNPTGETPSEIKADLKQCPWNLNKSSSPPAPSSESQTSCHQQSTLVVPKPAHVDPRQATPRSAPTPPRIVPQPRIVPPPEPQPTPRLVPPPPPPPRRSASSPPQGKPLIIKIR